MASPVLNHLQVDALLPLAQEEHGHGHGHKAEAADLSTGFTRVPLTLCPPFSSEVRRIGAVSCIPVDAHAASVETRFVYSAAQQAVG